MLTENQLPLELWKESESNGTGSTTTTTYCKRTWLGLFAGFELAVVGCRLSDPELNLLGALEILETEIPLNSTPILNTPRTRGGPGGRHRTLAAKRRKNVVKKYN